MLEEVQLADITGIDILGNLSKDFVDAVCAVSPGHKVFAPLSIPFEFFYIATTLDAATVTPGLRYVPTVTYDTCPRDLDIVIIGGPFPGHRPPQADKFMREAWESVRVWMTTCIGSLWLAHSGVLEGKKVTTNRMFLPAARQMYPGIEWVDQRWIVQEKEYDGKRGGGKGELWTAGGAGCGEYSPFHGRQKYTD
jgi:transcriptional regulator GlxA family with amidase domain